MAQAFRLANATTLMSGDGGTLLALSRAEHEAAKRLFVRSRIGHLATLILTLPTLFLDVKWAYFLALLALVTEIAAWAYRICADRRHSLAEEGRRRALLRDAFDTRPGALTLSELRVSFSERAQQMAPGFEDADYYASSEAPGLERLRDLLQESAFWSYKLYAAAACVMGIAAGALLVFVVIALFIIIGAHSADSPEYLLIVARVGVLFLSFLVVSDVATDALAWHHAATRSKDVTRRLEGDGLEDQPRVLAVFGDYSVATATPPPIPSFLYRRSHDRIERAWRGSK